MKSSFLMPIVRSLKVEFGIVVGVLAVLMILPALAVVVIANAGITEVAVAVASVNPVTHKVEVHDPNGQVVAQLKTTTVWPVQGVITLEFGEPDPPYQFIHTGIDIANRHRRIGDPVTTFMAGKVTKVESWPFNLSGYGEYVVIDHGNGITSLYAHLSDTMTAVGRDVKPGDVIGLEGATGNATGPHVHFEIRVLGLPVNPRTFMVGNPDPGV